MSSSDQTPPRNWGTIFMGPGPMGEMTLGDVSNAPSMAWDPETEARYQERVRERAAEAARETIAAAQAEAESIRQAAHERGHAEGMEQAQRELEEFRVVMGDSASAILNAIEGRVGEVLESWKDDLTGVLRLAVERMVGITLSKERAAILEALYLDALRLLDDQRQLTIRVHPEDEAAVADIIQAAKDRTPSLGVWKVKAEPALEPGGLRIETQSGLADNSLAARRAAIDQILDGLKIPE